MDKWYYKCRDGSYYLGAIKQTLKWIIDFEEAIPHLEKMDYPLYPNQWKRYAKHTNPMGRYISYCNLSPIKKFGFADRNLFDLK